MSRSAVTKLPYRTLEEYVETGVIIRDRNFRWMSELEREEYLREIKAKAKRHADRANECTGEIQRIDLLTPFYSSQIKLLLSNLEAAALELFGKGPMPLQVQQKQITCSLDIHTNQAQNILKELREKQFVVAKERHGRESFYVPRDPELLKYLVFIYNDRFRELVQTGEFSPLDPNGISRFIEGSWLHAGEHI